MNQLVEDTRSHTASLENEGITSQAGFSLIEAIKTSSFWFLAAVYLMFSLSFHLILTHIVPHASDLGITAARSAIIISLIGGSTIPGRLITGWASDKIDSKRLAICCAFIQFAAMVWLIWSNTPWMLYIFAVVFGFTFGGLSNLMATMIGNTFGTANLGSITGTLVVGFTIGATIGPALGGIIFDSTDSYLLSFLIGAMSAAMAVLFMALTKPESRSRFAKAV
jgi:MFS family permease